MSEKTLLEKRVAMNASLVELNGQPFYPAVAVGPYVADVEAQLAEEESRANHNFRAYERIKAKLSDKHNEAKTLEAERDELREAVLVAVKLANIFHRKVTPLTLSEDSYAEYSASRDRLQGLEAALAKAGTE